MNNILLKIQRFFFEENISKAKKRYLFLVPCVLMGIFEFVSLKMIPTPPEQIIIIILTVGTAVFAGIATVFLPRLIGLFGINNLYFSAFVITALLSAYGYSTNPDMFTPLKLITGFITSLLPYMFVMWLAIFLSKSKNNPNQNVEPIVTTPVD